MSNEISRIIIKAGIYEWIKETAGSWRRYALYGITFCVLVENTPNSGDTLKEFAM